MFVLKNYLIEIYFIQNVAYKGTDFIPLANPKFLVEILIAYLGLYLFI